MSLSTEDAADLVALKAAYRRLIRGEAGAKVNAFGRQVEYHQADLGRLKAEIDRLEAEAASGSGRRRGALRFVVR